MLTSFDWLRRCATGAELLATIQYLGARPNLFPDEEEEEVGPPHSALDGPCQRCWVYPRRTLHTPHCRTCQTLLARAARLGGISRQSIVLWSFVSQLPWQLLGDGASDAKHLDAYVVDEHHFVLVMRRRELKPWIQELVLYYGYSLKGLIQVFPTTGDSRQVNMGELLCRAAHHEGRFGLDQLRVRFYTAPHQLLAPHLRDREGILTFEIAEFLSLLEMAAVFRTLLRPDTQQTLLTLLNLKDPGQEQFYWGRFMGFLSPKARDMLNAWQVRSWPTSRVKLLYELTD